MRQVRGKIDGQKWTSDRSRSVTQIFRRMKTPASIGKHGDPRLSTPEIDRLFDSMERLCFDRSPRTLYSVLFNEIPCPSDPCSGSYQGGGRLQD